MGWYYGYGATRRDVIKELTVDRAAEWTDDKGVHRVRRLIKHCLRGNVLYAVWECEDDKETHRFISVDLLGRDYEGNWGHKPMDEDMHPYYYTCPLSFFELAGPPRTDDSKRWRELTAVAHSAKKSEKAFKKMVLAR